MSLSAAQRKARFFGTLLLLMAFCPRAAAQDDMFANRGFGPYARPPVPSDRFVGPDVFTPAPVFIGPYPDVFDGHQAPYAFGDSDMFVTHPVPVPPYPLFDDRKK